MRITLRQLQAFVLTAEIGSISKVAGYMNLTQSAVSLLVKELEAAVGGATLLDRSSRPISLTEAGRQALLRAQLICSEAKLFSEQLRDYSELNRGNVRIGASVAIASVLLAPLVKIFRSLHPTIVIEIHETDPGALQDVIRKGSIDLALMTIEADDADDLVIEPVLRDRLSMIALRSDPNATRKFVTWRELSALKTISVRRPNTIREIIEKSMSIHAITFAPDLEVSNLATALSLVSEGLGCAVLPAYLVPYASAAHLVAVPLKDPEVTRTIALVRRRGRPVSPATSAFAALAKKELSSRGTRIQNGAKNAHAQPRRKR